MVALIVVSVILTQAFLPSLAFTSPTRQCSSLTSVGRQRLLSSCDTSPNHKKCNNHYHYPHSSALTAVPFSEAWDANTSITEKELESFSALVPKLGCRSLNSEGMLIQTTTDEENKRYQLYLATDFDDLSPITELTLDVFDATAITMSSSTDWSALEKAMVGAFVEPAVGMYNAYAQAVGYTEVLSGLRKRMRNRLSDNANSNENGNDWLAPLVVPDTSNNNNSSGGKETTLEDIAARSSLILALARPTVDSSGDKSMEVVASIELRLQPTDAKIPFSQPWLDKLERRLARLIPFANDEPPMTVTTTNKSLTSSDTTTTTLSDSKSKNNPPLRPYLCNLCVSSSLRSLGIGRALCRVVEAIAHEKWGYSHLYLHVDPTNDAAKGLYDKEGYKDVGRRWNVAWAGGANEISYYVKRLG